MPAKFENVQEAPPVFHCKEVCQPFTEFMLKQRLSKVLGGMNQQILSQDYCVWPRLPRPYMTQRQVTTARIRPRAACDLYSEKAEAACIGLGCAD